MSRRVVAALVAAALTAAGATFYYLRRPAPAITERRDDGEITATPEAGVVIVDATPLPDAFQSKGVASRRFGVMRVYVSAAPEIALRSETGDGVLQTVPVLIVLENDSYRALDARRDLGLDGQRLFDVEISGPSSEVVFQDYVPAENTVWEPAERKSFEVRWRPESPAPGEYVISVKPAFGGAGGVQLRTRLK
ncbi:MAG: hypothetical protein LC795_07325 [Acidobacteria bacterium]|nr:hypothetical protein [Acidobacteriota bacterium]